MISDPKDTHDIAPEQQENKVLDSPNLHEEIINLCEGNPEDSVKEIISDSEVTHDRVSAQQDNQVLNSPNPHKEIINSGEDHSEDMNHVPDWLKSPRVRQLNSKKNKNEVCYEIEQGEYPNVLDIVESDTIRKKVHRVESTEYLIKDEETEKSNPQLWKQKLIAETLKNDEAQYNKDLGEINLYKEEIQNWQERTKKLLDNLIQTNQICANLFDDCNEQFQALSEELQEKLKGRQEGLELVKKMLERVVEQIQTISASSDDLDLVDNLPEPNQQIIEGVINNQEDEDSAKLEINKEMKKIGNDRWLLVSRSRDLQKECQNKWLQFVDRKILPIIDGIENGQKHSENLIEELKQQYQNDQEHLSLWYGIYEKLRGNLIDMLESVQVHLAKVDVGMPIDYNKHQPCDVYLDKSLPEESIKEIVSQGYEYIKNSGEKMLLRPAQVIVVKQNREQH